MIGRFVDTIATLAAGLVIGWLISGSDKVSPDLASTLESGSGTATVLPAVRPAENKLTDSNNVRCAEVPSYTEQAAVGTPEPLPAIYRGLIGSLTEQTLARNASDRYVAFMREVRDEPWAAAMEAGITSWSTGKDQQVEMVIDYIQCRSHSCIVAGQTLTGNTMSLGDLRNQGWWQAEDAGMLKVKSARDGTADFLFFIGRYADTNE